MSKVGKLSIPLLLPSSSTYSIGYLLLQGCRNRTFGRLLPSKPLSPLGSQMKPQEEATVAGIVIEAKYADTFRD